jgi:hypothetical protein
MLPVLRFPKAKVDLLASVMIHSDAKRDLDFSCSTSPRVAEGMRFESHEGPSFSRSVTYDP